VEVLSVDDAVLDDTVSVVTKAYMTPSPGKVPEMFPGGVHTFVIIKTTVLFGIHRASPCLYKVSGLTTYHRDVVHNVSNAL
jgi:hypothetical protein